MKRIACAIAAIAVFAALLPAQAQAAPTLAQRVKALEGKLNCLKRTGMATWVGYAYYDEDGNVVPTIDPENDLGGIAANFVQAVGGTSDYWVVAINNTAACRKKLGIVRSPYSAPAPRALRQAHLLRLARIR